MARVCMVAYSAYPGDTRIRREAEALVHRGDEILGRRVGNGTRYLARFACDASGRFYLDDASHLYLSATFREGAQLPPWRQLRTGNQKVFSG